MTSGDALPSGSPQLRENWALTGMPRTHLASLIERLSVRQAAQAERRLYHRRGGERLPGARGGVFFEKITDAERVLITVLYQRQVCTRKVLAELFDVTPTTIGIACRRVGPLLEQDGYIPTPAPSLHTTATTLPDSVTPQTTPRNQHNRRVNSLRLPGEVKRFMARSRWRVGWWEFSARLFRYFDWRCSTERATLRRAAW